MTSKVEKSGHGPIAVADFFRSLCLQFLRQPEREIKRAEESRVLLPAARSLAIYICCFFHPSCLLLILIICLQGLHKKESWARSHYSTFSRIVTFRETLRLSIRSINTDHMQSPSTYFLRARGSFLLFPRVHRVLDDIRISKRL